MPEVKGLVHAIDGLAMRKSHRLPIRASFRYYRSSPYEVIIKIDLGHIAGKRWSVLREHLQAGMFRYSMSGTTTVFTTDFNRELWVDFRDLYDANDYELLCFPRQKVSEFLQETRYVVEMDDEHEYAAFEDALEAFRDATAA